MTAVTETHGLGFGARLPTPDITIAQFLTEELSYCIWLCILKHWVHSFEWHRWTVLRFPKAHTGQLLTCVSRVFKVGGPAKAWMSGPAQNEKQAVPAPLPPPPPSNPPFKGYTCLKDRKNSEILARRHMSQTGRRGDCLAPSFWRMQSDLSPGPPASRLTAALKMGNHYCGVGRPFLPHLLTLACVLGGGSLPGSKTTGRWEQVIYQMQR